MWSVIVLETATGNELAKYTYTDKRDAKECAKNVREVRVTQNRERVTIRVVEED